MGSGSSGRQAICRRAYQAARELGPELVYAGQPAIVLSAPIIVAALRISYPKLKKLCGHSAEQIDLFLKKLKKSRSSLPLCFQSES